MSVVEKKSYCRICGAACGVIVEVDDNTIVEVRADLEHPVSRGYTCPKGRAAPMAMAIAPAIVSAFTL